MILVIRDQFSKYTRLYPVEIPTAKIIIQKVEDFRLHQRTRTNPTQAVPSEVMFKKSAIQPVRGLSNNKRIPTDPKGSKSS